MSKEVKGYPHKQEFCVSPKPCKSKRNSWWNKASDNYWANRKRATKEDVVAAKVETTTEETNE